MDSTGPIVIAGALVGFAVGLTGMGGGALMTPIMVMVFGVNPTAAIGSDLAASVFMKPFGALVHQRAGTVRWDIVRWLLPTAVPAAVGGVFLLRALGDGAELQQRVKYVVGTALMLAVAGMLARLWLDRRRAGSDTEDAHVPVRPVATLLRSTRPSRSPAPTRPSTPTPWSSPPPTTATPARSSRWRPPRPACPRPWSPTRASS
ncbi:sulfite exporter TauE/SafE [Streptomyces sp. Ag109_O5-1]|nr:sulfite exporter TauE/SafE [Streptomyces sp. Ag109_O5-1]